MYNCVVKELSDVDPLRGINEIVLKKKMISMREHYDLEDRNGMKLGEADGNLFQFPASFVVKDINDSELMHIEGKIFSLRNQFSFYDNTGKFLGTMKRKLVKLIRQEYWVERDGVEFMRIFGNFTGHEYKMEVNGVQVASVHKKWFSGRDQLGLSITGGGEAAADHRVVLGALIAIEHIEVTKMAEERTRFTRSSF
jgi:uncharacterized protein YxjI